MTNFKKFKRFNIHCESDPIEGDIYIDLSQAEAIEFEEFSHIHEARCGRTVQSKPIKIIHISMNQSSHTVLDERAFCPFSAGTLTDAEYIEALLTKGGK